MKEVLAPLPVTDVQLYLLIGIPSAFNAVLIGLLMAYINAKFGSMNERFAGIYQRLDSMDRRFENINRRFDDMRDLWPSELHRVEGVLDARLRHIEEERR